MCFAIKSIHDKKSVSFFSLQQKETWEVGMTHGIVFED
jgi:hypothetical protein